MIVSIVVSVLQNLFIIEKRKRKNCVLMKGIGMVAIWILNGNALKKEKEKSDIRVIEILSFKEFKQKYK